MGEKCNKITAARQLLLSADGGISSFDLARALDVPQRTAQRYIEESGAQAVRTEHKRVFYSLKPTDDDIAFMDAVVRSMQRTIYNDGHITRKCWVCGDEFETATTQARYCSDACKREAQNERFYQYHRDEE